jgi:uncharacterized protein YndB with AHSA1/START domain
VSSSQTSISREVWIEAPAGRVWKLLTESDRLGQWFSDAGAFIDARPDGALELRWSHGAVVRGRVEAVEPESRLVFRWAPFRTPGGRDPGPDNSTVVEITLRPEGSGTRVRVHERGFDDLACSQEQRVNNRSDNANGWDIELCHLHVAATAGP